MLSPAQREAERNTGMDVIKEISEALEEGAEVLDPAKADPRAVVLEGTGSLPPPARKRRSRKPAPEPAPEPAEVRPSPKDLGKEHRGF